MTPSITDMILIVLLVLLLIQITLTFYMIDKFAPPEQSKPKKENLGGWFKASEDKKPEVGITYLDEKHEKDLNDRLK